MNCRSLSTLVISFLLWTAGNAVAQPADDYRLSFDPLNYSLPEDIRIEAAAESGAARLIVWGTTVDDGNGGAVNALAMNLNGTQRILTPANARPFGAVAVIPFADRFLVLWNDRRGGGEGIRGRVVTTSGAFGGDDYLLSGGVMQDDVYWWSGVSGAMIFWTDVRTGKPETYYIRTGTDGRMIGGETLLTGKGLDAEQSYPITGGRSLVRQKDNSVLIIRSDGTIDPRPIPDRRFNVPHYLIGDSSIATAQKGIMRYFESYYDSLPLWSVALPEKYGGPYILSKDSSGWFIVTFSKYLVPGRNVIQLLYFYFNADDPGDTATVLRPGYSLVDPAGTGAAFYGSGTEKNRTTYVAQNVVVLERSEFVAYRLKSSTFVDTSRGGVYKKIAGIDSCVDPRSPAARPLIRRTSSTVNSAVVAFTDSTDTTRSSVAFPLVPYRVPQFRPVIAVRNGYLCAGWRGGDDTLEFVRFNGGLEDADKRNRDVFDSASPAQSWLGAGVASVQNHVLRSTLNYVWSTYATPYRQVLTEEGWKFVAAPYKHLSGFERALYGRPCDLVPDPDNNRTTSVSSFDMEVSGSFQYQFRSTTNGVVEEGTMWSVVAKTAYRGFIPLDTSSGIFFDRFDSAFIFHNGGKLLRRFAFPAVNGYPEAIRPLYNRRFVHVRFDSARGSYWADLYDVSGNLLASKSVPFVPNARNLFVLQNPSNKTLVFLWGGGEGIRLSCFSENLEELVDPTTEKILTDIRISGTADSATFPHGIFRNDTLFAVWQDYREGPESDIYGTWWSMPKGVRVIDEDVEQDTITIPPELPVPGADPAAGIRILSITPNPAIGDIVVTVQGPERRAGSVEIFDGLGRSAIARQIILHEGVRAYPVDISRLPSGSYTVRITSGGKTAQWRIVVYQQ